MIKKILLAWLLMSAAFVQAAEYKIDTEGAHAFIQFRIKHLGYSWLYGRFDKFEGSFQYDAKQPNASTVSVTIDTNSLNSNHAERDKHLRDERFFDVAKFPQASFVSKSFVSSADGMKGKLTGALTLKGITKDIDIDVEVVGGGPDPWGGRRQGFTGKAEIVLKDFGFDFDLGPASAVAEVLLDVEGIKK
jgi:polyisoprenoid-binding protein YceI